MKPHPDRQRVRLADDLAELTARIAVHIVTVDRDGRTVVNRMREAMNGQPRAQNLEGDRTTGHTTVTDDQGWPMPSVSDPTGEAALRPDRAYRDLVELDKQLGRAHAAVEHALRILSAHTPRPSTEAERRKVEVGNTPGCESCARTEVAKGVRRWEPIYRQELCSWCWQWERDTGRRPTDAELAAHHDGKRLTRKKETR